MQTTEWSNDVGIEVYGDDVVSHAGSVITRMLAGRVSLTSALSAALDRPDVVHNRGRAFADLGSRSPTAPRRCRTSRSWATRNAYSGLRRRCRRCGVR